MFPRPLRGFGRAEKSKKVREPEGHVWTGRRGGRRMWGGGGREGRGSVANTKTAQEKLLIFRLVRERTMQREGSGGRKNRQLEEKKKVSRGKITKDWKHVSLLAPENFRCRTRNALSAVKQTTSSPSPPPFFFYFLNENVLHRSKYDFWELSCVIGKSPGKRFFSGKTPGISMPRG